MTDNRTTELREKLTEHGVEYTTNDHMGVCETSWNGFTAMQLTPNAKLTMVLTPEQAIAATLGSDAKPCYAADENYKRCKYSVNRGWCDDAPFLVWDDTGHLFITMGGLKTWDVTDDAKKWFAKLGSGTCEVECFDDGADEGMDGEWFSYAPPTWYLSCGHTAQGTEMPNFCPVCGKAVE